MNKKEFTGLVDEFKRLAIAQHKVTTDGVSDNEMAEFEGQLAPFLRKRKMVRR